MVRDTPDTTHRTPAVATDEAATRRAQEALQALGIEARFLHHGGSGRRSEDAARLTGAGLEGVVKCLVLEGRGDATPVCAILLGSSRLDTRALEARTGARDLRMASPERVLALTGFPIGGLPPVCLSSMRKVVVDERVFARETIVGSGGTEGIGLFVPTRALTQLGYDRAAIATPEASG